jgi:hypothetical protein
MVTSAQEHVAAFYVAGSLLNPGAGDEFLQGVSARQCLPVVRISPQKCCLTVSILPIIKRFSREANLNRRVF